LTRGPVRGSMSFSLAAPASEAEALRLWGATPAGEGAVLAGGTDLLRDIEDGRLAPRVLLSLRRLPWRQILWDGDELVVGSTAPLRDLERDPHLRARAAGLWEAVRAVGGVALRHRATLGGNLARASPASDLLPILLAYDAKVHLAAAGGDRTVALDAFLQGSRTTALRPGELIRSVRLTVGGPSTYVWRRVRPANDISQVGVAALRSPTPPYWRIALGGILPVPRRLPEVERQLAVVRPEDATVEAAATEAARLAPFTTDRRATEAYRRQVVAALVRRAVRDLRDRAPTGSEP
jgi:xanthine dehydrogenase small subunit